MVNTANAEGRVYRAERSHGKKNRRKFSSIMAMVLGAVSYTHLTLPTNREV